MQDRTTTWKVQTIRREQKSEKEGERENGRERGREGERERETESKKAQSHWGDAGEEKREWRLRGALQDGQTFRHRDDDKSSHGGSRR